MLETNAPDLSNEEKIYIREHLTSELMRVIKKAFVNYKSQTFSKLLIADQAHLPIVQGQLIGIQGCINTIDIKANQAVDVEDPPVKGSTAKDLVSAKERG
jgi:hypothetical protein